MVIRALSGLLLVPTRLWPASWFLMPERPLLMPIKLLLPVAVPEISGAVLAIFPATIVFCSRVPRARVVDAAAGRRRIAGQGGIGHSQGAQVVDGAAAAGLPGRCPPGR